MSHCHVVSRTQLTHIKTAGWTRFLGCVTSRQKWRGFVTMSCVTPGREYGKGKKEGGLYICGIYMCVCVTQLIYIYILYIISLILLDILLPSSVNDRT